MKAKSIPIAGVRNSAIGLLQTICLSTLANAKDPPKTKPDGCRQTSDNFLTVTDVIDAQTVVTSDGDRIYLDNIQLPHGWDAQTSDGKWQEAQTAKSFLKNTTVGHTVLVERNAAHPVDRYKRKPANIFVKSDDRLLWVQALLVQHGYARVDPVRTNLTDHCVDQLLRLEATARTKSIGLWSNPAYAPKRASQPYEILKHTGTYQLVRGRVYDVSIRAKTVYINFADDWKTDFTAIAKTTPPSGGRKSANLDTVKNLKGKWVIVRGWIERRRGPAIAIHNWKQIEVLKDFDQ